MHRPRVIALTAALIGLTACRAADADIADLDEPQAVELVAFDMGYEPPELTLAAGTIEVTLVNEGAAVHNVIVEELDDRNVVEAGPGQTATGAVQVVPGTYTVYCDIPGHRSAGMHLVLTVD